MGESNSAISFFFLSSSQPYNSYYILIDEGQVYYTIKCVFGLTLIKLILNKIDF